MSEGIHIERESERRAEREKRQTHSVWVWQIDDALNVNMTDACGSDALSVSSE